MKKKQVPTTDSDKSTKILEDEKAPQTLEDIENAQSNTLPTDEKHRDIREKSTSDIHSNLSNSDISRKTTFEKEQIPTTDSDKSTKILEDEKAPPNVRRHRKCSK